MYDPNMPTSFDYRDDERRPTAIVLKTCPFCDSPPDVFEDGEIQCSNKKCPVRPSARWGGAEVWNTRALTPPTTPSDAAMRAAEEIAPKSNDAWREWFDRIGDKASAEVVNATADLVTNERLAALTQAGVLPVPETPVGVYASVIEFCVRKANEYDAVDKASDNGDEFLATKAIAYREMATTLSRGELPLTRCGECDLVIDGTRYCFNCIQVLKERLFTASLPADDLCAIAGHHVCGPMDRERAEAVKNAMMAPVPDAGDEEYRSRAAWLREGLLAARDALVPVQHLAGQLPYQDGYSATMTPAELQISKIISQIDKLLLKDEELAGLRSGEGEGK